MSQYRGNLPQLAGKRCLTDGGMESTLVFHEGIELPCFAAFDVLARPGGEETIRRYMLRYIEIALRHGAGCILESATWRASPDWGARLGYSREALARVNARALALVRELAEAHATPASPMLVAGCIGPRGDGYVPGELMSPAEAEAYHAFQIGVFADQDADMVTALTLNNIPEAIGIARAARAAGVPVALSFTLETDGRLPTGDALGAAITAVDEATAGAPAYYMINCAHPSHFEHVLETGAPWLHRIRGLRANASRLSHAELDACTELDAGDPAELGAQYRALEARLGPLAVIGGCCGTDHRHVAAMAERCLTAEAAA